MFKQSFLVVSLLTASCSVLAAGNHHQDKKHNALGHAPISIMADHLHKQGEWMVSYRYMDMQMSGLQMGKEDISLDHTLSAEGKNYMMAPKDMQMKMHMLGMMYAPSDNITLMFMTNYLSNDMQMAMRMMNSMNGAMNNDMSMDAPMSDDMSNMGNGMSMDHSMAMQHMQMQTSSSGLGDSRIAALINAFNGDAYRSHFTIGLNLPTGDVAQTRTDNEGNKITLGYPMQLGTDTYNAFAAYTLTYQADQIQFGSQFNYETALEKNDAGYQPGDKIVWHNWAAIGINSDISISARLSYTDKDNFKGQDKKLHPMMMPSADANMRGVKQLDAAIGVNYVFNGKLLNGHRVAFELSKPISQDFDGIQMKTDSSLMLGWQKAF